MFLDQFFVKNAKNCPRTLFEQPKSDKGLKSVKCRNPREQCKKWPFSTFIIPKTRSFFKIFT